MVSPDSQAQRARCQAETPLIDLFKFASPALNVVKACEETIRALAPPDVFGEGKPYFVADVQQHLEILARAADAVSANALGVSLRSPISRPKNMGDDSWNHLLDALANRRGHLEDEIKRYHGSSMRSRREPVAALFEFIEAQRAASTGSPSAES